jgi:hypothetical protein
MVILYRVQALLPPRYGLVRLYYPAKPVTLIAPVCRHLLSDDFFN